MKMNLPNLLTLNRILLIPIAIVCYYLPFTWAHPLTAIIALFIGLSDFLDGYFARKFNQSTRFGAFLDPVADKLSVVAGLVLVTGEYHMVWLTLFSMVIIIREIVISALREWMASVGSRSSVKVLYIGKVKTTLQGIAMVVLLWYNPLSPAWLFDLGLVALGAAVLLTIWSMVVYLKGAWPEICRD